MIPPMGAGGHEANGAGPIRIDDPGLGIAEVEAVACRGMGTTLGAEARERVAASRSLIDAAAGSEASTYGLNTGVGRLASTRIPPDEVRELQLRVVRSHAAGTGEPYPPEVVRAAILLRAVTLAQGHSGVRPEVIDALLGLLDREVLPHVPARGSVGASGDLAPLAHVALTLIGEGEASVGGEMLPAADALARAGMAPLVLEAKEGLALVNGTQFMTAMGALAVARARRLATLADLAAALTCESLRGTRDSFAAPIHELRPHPGQLAAARNLHRAMEGSAIDASSAIAIASRSRTIAIGWPWKLPPVRRCGSSGKTSGLSVTAVSSIPITRAACSIESRLAPWTCGAQRSE